MSLNNRVVNLERRTNTEGEPEWIIVIAAGVEVTTEEIEEAQEQYKAKHPAWRTQASVVLPVGFASDHPLIDLLEKLDSGEWPSRR